MKRILITGANSYIGVSVENWLKHWESEYKVDTLDMQQENWREFDFSKYNTVFHVAGIAHADVGKVSEETKRMYYKVNTDLAINTAKRAKENGVKQFILMPSMIVYGNTEYVTQMTEPKPNNFYGDSKWQADKGVRQLENDNFKVVVVRPPMIYGKGSKGNYPQLSRLARKLPVFPKVDNRRSMLFIDNLCQFIKMVIDNEESGVFYPQNAEYTNTSDMVKIIAEVSGHRILMIPFMSPIIRFVGKFPGKLGKLMRKAFGNSIYDMSMSEYKDDYRVNDLYDSIVLTEEK